MHRKEGCLMRKADHGLPTMTGTIQRTEMSQLAGR
jgi:hypothetical protein